MAIIRSFKLLALALGLGFGSASAQLPVEQIPSVETLPDTYPANWVLAHDVAFYNLPSGRVFIVDPSSKEKDVHGIIDAGQFATTTYSRERNEIYVAETFYSRGMRGDRTDFLTIYDARTLNVAAQVELPGGKRSMSVTHKSALQQTNDGKFLLVFNFTPAASVTIFDLDTRSIVNEIQMPGCMLIYPNGERGFASLCGDGAMIAFDLDEAGQKVAEYRTDSFNDIDDDPLFMKVAYVGDVAYFTSFKGYIQAVELAGGAPVVRERIYLTGPVRAGEQSSAYARPAGWQVITRDRRGRIYLLMRPDAKDGDHKFGGSLVWVFDPGKQAVVREIPLKGNSISIEVTGGRNPMLVATSEEMHLDIYDLKSGDHLRKIGGWGPATPFTLHAVQK